MNECVLECLPGSWHGWFWMLREGHFCWSGHRYDDTCIMGVPVLPSERCQRGWWGNWWHGDWHGCELAPVGEYTCEMCGGTFKLGWSDEEALTEMKRDFPGLKQEDAAIVCDDCYKKCMRQFDA